MRHSSFNPDSTADPIGSAILGYLRDHPEAQDTARGIAEWWLPQRGIHCSRPELQRVLDRLVHEGPLTFHDTADGRRHYRLSRRPAEP